MANLGLRHSLELWLRSGDEFVGATSADASRPPLSLLWEAVCENATVSMFIIDEQRRCAYMNPAAERLTGFSLAEVEGRVLHELIHHTRPDGSRYPVEECQIVRAYPDHRHMQGEDVFVHRDGSFIPVAFTASPIRDSSANVLGTVVEVRDIRAELESKDALENESRMLEALYRSGKTLSAELNLERLVQSATDAGVELTGAEFGAFFYNVEDDSGQWYTLYSISGVPREAFSRFPMPRNTEVFGPTFSGTESVRSDDITKDHRYGRNPPHYGMPEGHLPVRSYLAVPVVSNSGEVLGGLFFGHSRPGVFSERAERMVAGIAAQAAIAVDNARLFRAAEQEIEKRSEAERKLRLLLDELNHRVKNTLATVQAIASQTLGQPGEPGADHEAFVDRLLALSYVHNQLAEQDWDGADLHDLVHHALRAFADQEGTQIAVDGEPLKLRPKIAQSFAMALHELATNAAKHGALSNGTGRVEVSWWLSPPGKSPFRFEWRETGGPPAEHPDSAGFGTKLLTRIWAREISGSVKLEYVEGGLICSVAAADPRAASRCES